MKIREIDHQKDERSVEEENARREEFWDKKCEKEPAHPGCKIYDL